MTINIELLEAALTYLRLGFSIIPLKQDKKPLLPSWKEFQSRFATEDEVNTWFKQYQVEGIGIVTGAISGIAVVDIEKDGNMDDLPPTVMSQTGGGGWHLYYKYDKTRPLKNYTRIRELTDIRGEGGYVVAPPSLHKSGKQYLWLTPTDRESLAEFPYWLIDKPPIVSAESSQRSQVIDASVIQGKRNATAAQVAGKILHDLDPQLWETAGWLGFQGWNTNTCQPPLEQRELRMVWESISKNERQKSRSKSKFDKNMQSVIEIYWQRPRDGRIIEAYYDPNEQETGLLVFEKGTVIKTNQILIGTASYSAPPPTNNLIKPGFIKLPSDATTFESEVSLLNEVQAFIHAFVQIPADFESLAAFYVLFSWVYDEFQELPYFRAIGDYGSGKSRFLKVMGALCCRSIFLNGSASASSMFRMMNEVKGTIVLDEADFRLSDTSNEVVKILNSGFQKGIPVFRSEATGNNAKSYDPTPFDVFGPKVIATRKDFMDDALESRCLSNAMDTLTREDIPENLENDFDEKALVLRNKLVMFRFLKLSGGISKVPLPKLNIEPRLKQIISPLYRAIDDPAGKDIILNFIRSKQREVLERRYGSLEGEVLQSLVKVLEGGNEEPTMKDIAVAYNAVFGGKYPVKAKKIGSILEQTFHLEKRKGATGIYLCSNAENEERIKKSKIKFGLCEPELNIVNDVNVPSQPMTAERIAELFDSKVEPNL